MRRTLLRSLAERRIAFIELATRTDKGHPFAVAEKWLISHRSRAQADQAVRR
jgi:hypothetical protein